MLVLSVDFCILNSELQIRVRIEDNLKIIFISQKSML